MVAHSLREFVSVDVFAKDFLRRLFVLLEERRTRESHEHRIRHDGLHGLVKLTGMRPVALVNEDGEVALDRKARRQGGLDLGYVLFHRLRVEDVVVLAPIAAVTAKLVDKRTEEPPARGVVDAPDKILSALRADDLLVHSLEELFNLLVKFIAVGDNQYAPVGITLDKKLGENDHLNRLAGALRMPDDAALALGGARKRTLDAVVLAVAGNFLLAPVKYNEVSDDAQEPLLVEHLVHLGIQLLTKLCGLALNLDVVGVAFILEVGKSVMPPFEILLCRRLDSAVSEALA